MEETEDEDGLNEVREEGEKRDGKMYFSLILIEWKKGRIEMCGKGRRLRERKKEKNKKRKREVGRERSRPENGS